MNNFPKISIVIVTLNNEKTLPFCINSLIKQDYPKKMIEYINIDGGSTDGTKTIMKEAGFQIVDSPIKRNAEAQRAIGLKEARNEIIVSLDADNYLPTKHWLKQMVQPFMDNDKVVHTHTLHFTYREDDSLFNKYFALYGVADPVVYYVGRPDRLSWHSDQWTLGDEIEDRGAYYLVKFSEKNLPTVGCNGVLYRKSVLLKYANSSPDKFLHIDVFVDLIRQGYNLFAVVKNDVIHATAYTLSNLISKRTAFLSDYYFKQSNKRRYMIYNPARIKDNIRLSLFIFYTITFLKPLIDSFRGYIKIPNTAWFIHPFVCWAFLYAYSKVVFQNIFHR